ncbi:MAG: DUF2683 family protein [Candidatus Micrarchaeota archaeon]|nr:DUF2683 family protein [Candidatus Micrarchaeota archaeon]
MVNALVNISENANRVLNVVKAKYGLKDKSQAIEMVTAEYAKRILEPEFRPEFVAKVQKARKGPFRRIQSLDDLGLKTDAVRT